eukprot:4493750-Pyramimonas_sp.AAC.2
MPRCATAPRIHRLRWHLKWARRPEDFGIVVAAIVLKQSWAVLAEPGDWSMEEYVRRLHLGRS